MPPKSISIAVLILPPIQLLDLSPIDLFHMLSRKYLQECNLPAPFVNLGLDDVKIYYVAENGPSSTDFLGSNNTTTTTTTATVLAETTASAAIRITSNFTSSEVQPGAVDIMLVPGPDPSLHPSEAAKTFIRSHAACSSTTIMSVCTGILPLAHSGILDGRTCTGPRAFLDMMLRKDFPDVKWTEVRWEVDYGRGENGELWTAGGITNGQDMVAGYIREKFSRELADMVSAFADVGGRAREYDTGKTVEGMWWAWLLFRSWVGGWFRGSGVGNKMEKYIK